MALDPITPQRNQLLPLIPQEGFDFDPPDTSSIESMPNPMPNLPLPGLRPLVTNPRKMQEDLLQGKIGAYENPAAPQGGFWHRLGHIANTLRNVAETSLVPNIAAADPTSSFHQELQHGANVRELAGLQSQDTEEQNAAGRRALEGAQTAKTQEETAEMPEASAERRQLQDAQIANLLHPQAKTAFEAWRQQHPSAPVEDWLKAEQAGKNVRPDTPEQQYIDEYQKKNPGASVASAERAYTLDTQRPPQIAPIMMMVPNPEGGATAQVIHPGQSVAPGTTTATQFGSQQVPTTQQRNVGAQASLVHEQMPGLINEIQQNKDLIGPVAGRWNEFMQGKVGLDNPAMAGLRSDLLMMSSAVALMHARGRLPENLREEFDRTINAPNQTAENLVTSLQHIDQWTKANINAMKNAGGEGNNAPPPGAKIRDYTSLNK